MPASMSPMESNIRGSLLKIQAKAPKTSVPKVPKGKALPSSGPKTAAKQMLKV